MFKPGLRSLALWGALSAGSMMAQAAGFEVNGFGGGIWLNDGVGNHGVFGGQAAVVLRDHVHIFGEVGYTTNLLSSVVSELGVAATGSEHQISYGAGADYSFRSPDAKLRPYAFGALGVAHISATVTSVDGYSAFGSAGGNQLYSAFGGGVRWYIGHNWGLKPEFRYQGYTGVGTYAGTTGYSAQYTMGLFFRVGH